MKTRFSILLASLALAFGLAYHAGAQTTDTNAPPSPISGPGKQAYDFLFGAGSSNWIVAPYGMLGTGAKSTFGGGLAAGYRLSDFAVPFLRFDYFNSQASLISATMQLQLPIRILDTLDLIPIAYSGLGTPISGFGNDNGQVVGVFGAGAAVRVASHWDVIAAYEKRTSFPGGIVILGIGYKPKGW